jgi:DNA-binding MarR family transcriptional regulator
VINSWIDVKPHSFLHTVLREIGAEKQVTAKRLGHLISRSEQKFASGNEDEVREILKSLVAAGVVTRNGGRFSRRPSYSLTSAGELLLRDANDAAHILLSVDYAIIPQAQPGAYALARRTSVDGNRRWHGRTEKLKIATRAECEEAWVEIREQAENLSEDEQALAESISADIARLF